METAYWHNAREGRERKGLEDRAPNIFKGGSVLETARIGTITALRLGVWPKGASAPPFSFALDPVLAFNSALGNNDPDVFDEDFPEDDGEKERRGTKDFTEEFKDFSGDDVTWSPAENEKLPLNLEWQQSAESRWDFYFDLAADASCMGLGEHQSGLNLRSAVHTLFNTDDHVHLETIDPMYKSIPFLIMRHQGQCYGLFLDSPARQRWDLDSELGGRAHVQLLSRRGWQLYCLGPGSLPDIVSAYTILTGRSKLPPTWALGHQQSRWSYPDEETAIRVAHEFRSRSIPCDVIVLDIDYMDDYKVFTHSKERFPHFKDMVSDLGANGFKVVTIVDPAVKKDGKYFVFNDGKKHDFFCTKSDGKMFIGEVWPGESALPDFLREDVRMWWAAHHGFHTELGVAGIWNDMNEPALFKNQKPLAAEANDLPPDKNQLFMQDTPEGKVGHFEVRNLYGLEMSRATWEGLQAMRPTERPFVLSRSAYAGIQRYAAVWLGDNMSWWEHLSRSIPMLVNMGLSGVPFCGVDIGGFGHDCSAELLVRWYALGIFYPFFRNHCSMHGKAQEPWVFSAEVEDHCRKMIETRYKLIPYIENLFYEHTRTGAPLMRPMSWHYPIDAYAEQIDDQFLFGEDIMVAPILQRGRTVRSVYFPAGKWYSFDGEATYEGGRLHKVTIALGEIPAFVRDGAIIPLADVVQHTGELESAGVTFHAYGDKCTGMYYQDDGQTFNYVQDDLNLWRITIDERGFKAQPTDLGFDPSPRDYRMLYKGKRSAVVLSS